MALPSLPRVRTATVPLLRRYYGVLRRPASLSPRFVAFAWRYHALRLSFRSHRPRTPTAGRGFTIRSPWPDCYAWRRSRTSQVPGEPSCPYALFFDPGRTTRIRPIRCAGTAPVMSTTKAPTITFFRGSIARPWDSLSTLRELGRPSATQDSLPAAGHALPDRIGYL
jgi:hypothetical protein